MLVKINDHFYFSVYQSLSPGWHCQWHQEYQWLSPILLQQHISRGKNQTERQCWVKMGTLKQSNYACMYAMWPLLLCSWDPFKCIVGAWWLAKNMALITLLFQVKISSCIFQKLVQQAPWRHNVFSWLFLYLNIWFNFRARDLSVLSLQVLPVGSLQVL